MRIDLDRFCAGSSPPQNGLEERLDMIVAQLSAIAIELNKLNAVPRDDTQDKDVVAQ
jgi:hypothetical protein